MANHSNWHDQQQGPYPPSGSTGPPRHHMNPYAQQQQQQAQSQPSHPSQQQAPYPPQHQGNVYSPANHPSGRQSWGTQGSPGYNDPSPASRSSGPYPGGYEGNSPMNAGASGPMRQPAGHLGPYGHPSPYASQLHAPDQQQHLPSPGSRGGIHSPYDYSSNNNNNHTGSHYTSHPPPPPSQQQQQQQHQGNWNAAPLPSVLQHHHSANDVHPGVHRASNSSENSMGRSQAFVAPKAEEDLDDDEGGAFDDFEAKGKGRTGDAGQGANKGTSDFVKKLFCMLDDRAYESVVGWSPAGESFIVRDMNGFTKHVLPRNFRHSNFASFVRQLNKYDFHKVKNPDDITGNVGEHIWEFQHPAFVRGREDLLDNVKRKTPNKKKAKGSLALEGERDDSPSLLATVDPADKPAESYSELKAQVMHLTNMQDQMQTHIAGLTKQYQGVIGEMLTFQRNMAQQDQLMQNLIQYLMNLEQDRQIEPVPGPTASNLLGGPGTIDESPFLPSEIASKLVASYEDVAQASFAQMSEISRRAGSAGSKSTVGNPSTKSSTSEGTARTSASHLTGTTAASSAAPVSPKSAASPMDRKSSRSSDARDPDLPKLSMHPPHLTTDEHDNLINAASQSTNNPDLSAYDKAGLRVFTVGTLQPREGSEDYLANNGAEASSSTKSSLGDAINHSFGKRSTPGSATSFGLAVPQLEDLPNGMPKVDMRNGSTDSPAPNANGKEGSATPSDGGAGSSLLRVRRSTVVPGWAVPPRVLLVDDDEVCRRLSSKFLQVFGCSIDYAVDGMSAVNKMNLEKYDLVLMDIVMPNLDGVSATSLIRQFDPQTPIISMTSNSGPSELINYMRSGMNDILPKPFTRDGLLNMLEKHLIHLKTVQKLEQIPKNLGLGSIIESGLQQALGMSGDTPSGSGPTGEDAEGGDGMLNPLAGMGFTDEEYIAMLQNLISAGTVSDPDTGLSSQPPDASKPTTPNQPHPSATAAATTTTTQGQKRPAPSEEAQPRPAPPPPPANAAGHGAAPAHDAKRSRFTEIS